MNYFTKKCNSCQGTGREYTDKDYPCFTCDGKGFIKLTPELKDIMLDEYYEQRDNLYESKQN